jgi:hypothetical protein
VKFIADINLGKLAKWLRIFGYDTIYYRGAANRNFLREAQAENRVALTRKRKKNHCQFDGWLMIIYSDHVQQQLADVIDNFGLVLRQDRLFKLCIRCNEPLSEMRREEAKEIVPSYVYENHLLFKRCPKCKRVFWPGTHKDKANQFVRSHIQKGHL